MSTLCMHRRAALSTPESYGGCIVRRLINAIFLVSRVSAEHQRPLAKSLKIEAAATASSLPGDARVFAPVVSRNAGLWFWER